MTIPHTGSFHIVHRGAAIRTALADCIRAARRTLSLNLYNFVAANADDEITTTLIERARAGVQVRVLCDGLGSRIHPSLIRSLNRIPTLSLRIFRPVLPTLYTHPSALYYRNHARLLLADGSCCGVGSFCVGPSFDQREDLLLLLHADEVLSLSRYFDFLWDGAATAWPDPTARRLCPAIHALFSSPHHQEIYAWLLAALPAARRRITLVSAFFFPPRAVCHELVKAVARGVHVQLITPAQTDQPFQDFLRFDPLHQLIQSGVHWYGTPTYFHQKYALIDDLWLCGSANLDHVGLRRSYECNLWGRHADIHQSLSANAAALMRSPACVRSLPTRPLHRRLSRFATTPLGFCHTTPFLPQPPDLAFWQNQL